MRPARIITMLFCMLFSISSNGQNYIYTIAGTSGWVSEWGNGGLAIQAGISFGGMDIDPAGNIYLSGYNNIRKITASTGIIDTIPVTLTSSYTDVCLDSVGNIFIIHQTSGLIQSIDPNTFQLTYYPAVSGGQSFCFDKQGNLYVLEHFTNTIKKRDAITNITSTYANVTQTTNVMCIDHLGNIYYHDNFVIKKINGVTLQVTTFAGNGVQGTSGDGGPAVNASFTEVMGLAADPWGNIYVSDYERIRKIDMNTGIISTYAGMIGATTTDEGAPALNTSIQGPPTAMNFDEYGNLYYKTDVGTIRKITATPSSLQFSTSNFSISVYNQCNSTYFIVTTPTYNSNHTLKTIYNDGTSSTHPFTNNIGNIGYLPFSHGFPLSGHYFVKHILYNSGMPIDSIEYDYNYQSCKSISVNYYYDKNNNCNYDALTDEPLGQPILVRVDSNSVPIDTLSTMSGVTYNAFGYPGDVYSLNIIGQPFGMLAPCPSVISTISSSIDIDTQKVGVQCDMNSGFDLSVVPTQQCAANRSETDIIVNNTYCHETNGQLTMTFSPKYIFNNATPPPSSQTANTLIWDLDTSDFQNNFIYLHVRLDYNTNILTPGDTVQTTFELTPTTGDANTANNIVIRHDTVTGPFDPNAVYVNPTGCVEQGDELEYTVTFENMGNDTAHQIYVMDTLSAGVNMNTFKLLAASHLVNVTKVNSNGYNILKFEYPNINLPDSSSPDRHGMVMYTIKTAYSWPFWDTVTNKAGIYFDYMPAVLTNVAVTPNCVPANVHGFTSKNNTCLVYPNPATNEIIIKTGNQCTNYIITNSLGQVLNDGALIKDETRVNIASLPAGVYYISVRGSLGTYANKFIKL